jgi:hypothetical protein
MRHPITLLLMVVALLAAFVWGVTRAVPCTDCHCQSGGMCCCSGTHCTWECECKDCDCQKDFQQAKPLKPFPRKQWRPVAKNEQFPVKELDILLVTPAFYDNIDHHPEWIHGGYDYEKKQYYAYSLFANEWVAVNGLPKTAPKLPRQ